MCCENVAAQMGATLCSILFSVYCSGVLTPSSFPLFIIHWPLSFPNPQRDTPRLFISLLCVSWGWIPLDSHQPPWSYSPVQLQSQRCCLPNVISALLSAPSLLECERKSNVKIHKSTIFNPLSVPEDYVLAQWLSWSLGLSSLKFGVIFHHWSYKKQYPAAAESDKRLILALIQSDRLESLKETFHSFFVFVSSKRWMFSGQLRTLYLEFNCFHQPF